jgi:3,4-dehydroadipyl-CoA semialdehyde dehydrogenase
MRTLQSFLQDTWQTGTGAGASIANAYTGEQIASASTAGLDLGAALAHARNVGGPNLRNLSFAERGDLLTAMSGAVHEAREELIALSIENTGSTRKDAKFDIDGASGTLAYYGGLGRKLGDSKVLLDGEQVRISRSKRFMGQHIYTPRVGVAIHINAFNFPAWNMCEKAASALLAGMPVMTKPATSTVVTAERVVRLWVDKGILPAGALSLMSGSASDLLDHVGGQDCVVFTGSGDTGRKIKSHPQVMANNVPVNVEADSLNAAVLGPDLAPGDETFDMFLNEVSTEITLKAGQKCTAVRRILIPAARLDDALEGLKDRLDAAVLGDPSERSTTVGPLATSSQKRDIEAGIATLSETASRVYGDPSAVPESGFHVAPQLFLAEGGKDAAFVHEHEIFGPVAAVLPYSGDAAEAVEIVAQGGGGLVASVFSDDAAWSGEVVLGIAPWHGRVLWGSKKVHDQSTGHGTVMPSLVHGGPGKAGGGEELGGERGMHFYMQRTAVQGDTSLLKRLFGSVQG